MYALVTALRITQQCRGPVPRSGLCKMLLMRGVAQGKWTSLNSSFIRPRSPSAHDRTASRP